MTAKQGLLTGSLPELAEELVRLLHREGLVSLEEQVPSLPIVDRCRCGDGFCATIYTTTAADRVTAFIGLSRCIQVKATSPLIYEATESSAWRLSFVTR